LRRAANLVGVLLLCIGAVLFATGSRVRAASGPVSGPVATLFQLSARADTVGEEVIATGFPVIPAGKLAFVTLSSAQASLDTTTSQAFASAPYPGDFVVSLPSTVNGLGSGILPPFPTYPFYVSSSNPTSPKAGQQVGPYQVAAASDDHSSQGDSLIGLSTIAPRVASGTSHASVTRDPNTGMLVSVAESHIAPFEINNLLSLGDIRSFVKLTYDPANAGAGVVKQSSFSIGTITIGGVQVGLTEKGLSLAGKTLLPVDLSALQKLLLAKGVSIEYVPATQTATSITSAALQITYHNAQLPAPFMDTTLRFVLGQATATADPGASVPGIDSSLGSGVGAVGSTVGGGVGSTGASTGGATGSTGLGSGSGSGAVGSGSVSGAQAPVVSGGRTPQSASGRIVPRRLIRAPLTDLSNFYLIFVAGGLVALGSSRLVQWLALRGRLNPAP
jgi:hypothetical protein